MDGLPCAHRYRARSREPTTGCSNRDTNRGARPAYRRQEIVRRLKRGLAASGRAGMGPRLIAGEIGLASWRGATSRTQTTLLSERRVPADIAQSGSEAECRRFI